jgi:serine/threonine protein kinase
MKIDTEEIASPSKNIYRELELLGKGNFGSVVKAVDQHGQLFAIKKLDLGRLQQSKALEYLVTEQLLMHTIDHPRILRIHEQFKWRDSYLLVTTLCNGGDLDRVIFGQKTGSGLGEARATAYFVQILEGMCELAKHKIMHRDLKLGNILLHNQSIVIGDFGLAKMGLYAISMVGSYYYIAPEILFPCLRNESPRKYDSKVDVWSLGVCYYALLFGRFPFNGKDNNELKLNIERASGEKLMIPDQFKVSQETHQLLRQMLEVDPAARIGFEELFLKFEIRSQNAVDINALFVSNKSVQNSEETLEYQKSVREAPKSMDYQNLIKRSSFSLNGGANTRPSSNKFNPLSSGTIEETFGYMALTSFYKEEDHKTMLKITYCINMIIFYMNVGKELTESTLIRQLNPDIWDIGLLIFEIFVNRKSEICLAELKKAFHRQRSMFNLVLSNDLLQSQDLQYYSEFLIEVEANIENFYRLNLEAFRRRYPNHMKFHDKYKRLDIGGINSRLKEGTKKMWDYYLEQSSRLSESGHKELLLTIYFLIHATDFQMFFGQAYLSNPFNLVKFHKTASSKSHIAIRDWIKIAYEIHPQLLQF